MEIYSGNYKVIDSGSVITFDSNSGIDMILKIGVAFSVKLKFSFEENGGERSFDKIVDEKSNTISIRCINFDAGAGTVEPIRIAAVGGKSVYLHFWVEKLSANNYIRKLEYAAFIESRC